MADQTRKPKPKKDEEQAKAESEETTESTTEDIDDLLDEIDEVLEVNSEEFVRSFIQKGGQALVPIGAMAGGSIGARIMIGFVLLLYGWRMSRRSS
jgi:prokaryotic ubiquitin-like protein Pup